MLVLLLFVCFVCLEGSFKVIWKLVYVTQGPASLVSHCPHGNREFHVLTLKGTAAHAYTCLGCEGVLVKWSPLHTSCSPFQWDSRRWRSNSNWNLTVDSIQKTLNEHQTLITYDIVWSGSKSILLTTPTDGCHTTVPVCSHNNSLKHPLQLPMILPSCLWHHNADSPKSNLCRLHSFHAFLELLTVHGATLIDVIPFN